MQDFPEENHSASSLDSGRVRTYLEHQRDEARGAGEVYAAKAYRCAFLHSVTWTFSLVVWVIMVGLSATSVSRGSSRESSNGLDIAATVLGSLNILLMSVLEKAAFPARTERYRLLAAQYKAAARKCSLALLRAHLRHAGGAVEIVTHDLHSADVATAAPVEPTSNASGEPPKI